MVKAYGGLLILMDVLLILVKTLYYIGESLYRLFVPIPEKSVAGEIVLVTGAGHGIGRELALRYAYLGATVVCWDYNQQTNEETVNKIKKLGTTRAHGYKCDVSNREEVFKVAEKVKQDVGDVTILVNNAGIMQCHEFLDYTPEQIKRVFEVNVFAHIWTLQAFLPSMIQNNHGHVVALSSLAGVMGIPNAAPYCASKFAVRGLMETLSEELRVKNKETASNVNFTTIYPYIVDTGLCKKPKIKFQNLLPMVTPEHACNDIVSAQRRNIAELGIPSYLLLLNHFFRCLPRKTAISVIDFVGSGVDPEQLGSH